MLATILSCGQAAISAASTLSLPVVITPTLPCRRSASCEGDRGLSSSFVSTSKCSRSLATTSGKTLRAIRMEGRVLMAWVFLQCQTNQIQVISANSGNRMPTDQNM